MQLLDAVGDFHTPVNTFNSSASIQRLCLGVVLHGTSCKLAGVQEYLATRGLDTPVEVETRTLEEVDEVVGLLESTNPPRISRVMLDNMARPSSAFLGAQDSVHEARRGVTGAAVGCDEVRQG